MIDPAYHRDDCGAEIDEGEYAENNGVCDACAEEYEEDEDE